MMDDLDPELVEKVADFLKEQMEAQADDTTPSSIQRAKGLIWLEGWFDIPAALSTILPDLRAKHYAEALEMAAKVAEEQLHLGHEGYDLTGFYGENLRCRTIAAEIRALKDAPHDR